MMSSNNNKDQDYLPFVYKERILLSPHVNGNSIDVGVRFETHASIRTPLQQQQQQQQPKMHLVPVPHKLSGLLQSFGASRVLIQTGSSPTHSFPPNGRGSIHVEPWSTSTSGDHARSSVRSDVGPSGVSIQVWFPSSLQPPASSTSPSTIQLRFLSLLRYLSAQRIILAPLDTVDNPRLHRWIYERPQQTVNNITGGIETETLLQVILPLEGQPVSAEGVQAFLQSLPCQTSQGIFSALGGNPKRISDRLLANSVGTLSTRRTTWIDLQSNCHQWANDAIHTDYTRSHCSIGIHHGMQYATKVRHKSGSGSGSLKPLTFKDILPPESTKQQQACPIADSTLLQTIHSGSSSDNSHHINSSNGIVHTQQLNDTRDWSTIPIHLPVATPTTTLSSSFWSIHRTIHRTKGVANKGTLITIVENNHACASVMVQVTDVFPNMIKPKWRTLSFRIAGRTSHKNNNKESANNNDMQRDSLELHPDVTWNKDGSAQMILNNATLLPHSMLYISLEYDPVFSSFQQFPGDPNRGVEMPPSVATFVASSEEEQFCHNSVNIDTNMLNARGATSATISLYSNTLLLMPPVPDMSMPFNVISISSTFYAFIVGTLINLLVRRSSERIKHAHDGTEPPKHKLVRLQQKVKEVLTKLRLRLLRSQNNPIQTDTEPQTEPQTET